VANVEIIILLELITPKVRVPYSNKLNVNVIKDIIAYFVVLRIVICSFIAISLLANSGFGFNCNKI
jgi:hypothetical protein